MTPVKLLNLLGRGIGALSGAVLAVCWAYIMWVPTGGLHLSGVSFVVSLLLALGALFCVIAAIRGHSPVLILVFLASFFPIGVTLLQADNWLRWVGWLDFGLLIGGALMWATARVSAATPADSAGRS